MNRARTPSLLVLAAALSLSLAAGCRTRPPELRGLENEGLVAAPSLASLNPRDVVVLPIQNQTGKRNLPLDEMRKAFQNGLVRLRYSPLALDYVDQQAVEASYRPGDLKEQAVLQIFLNGWDTSLWRAKSRVVIEGDVYLLDARSQDVSRALWGGHVSRQMDLAGDRTRMATDQALFTHAAERFADEVLASLPSRDPRRSP